MATATSSDLKNAEDWSSTVLLIYSKMSLTGEELVGPIKVEEDKTLKGLRRDLKMKKAHKNGAVYFLLVAKLKDKEKKIESEERIKKHLQEMVEKAFDRSEEEDSSLEPEPKKAKMEEEGASENDLVVPVYVGETGIVKKRFTNHDAINMFFRRFEKYYLKRNYGLFLWLAPNPKSLAW